MRPVEAGMGGGMPSHTPSERKKRGNTHKPKPRPKRKPMKSAKRKR